MAELNTISLINDASLEAYYRFESGAETTDSSTNSNTLTAINTPTYVGGKYGNGTHLIAASTQNFTIADTAALKPTAAFSVGGWIRTSTTADQMVFESYQQNTGVAGFQLTETSAGVISFNTGKNTGTGLGSDYQRVLGTTDITDGAWHHIIGVWTGSYLKVYVDGVEDNTQVAWAVAPVYHANNAIRIGVNEYVTGVSKIGYWNGDLDDIYFFSRTLTDAEILQLYKDGADKFFMMF